MNDPERVTPWPIKLQYFLALERMAITTKSVTGRTTAIAFVQDVCTVLPLLIKSSNGTVTVPGADALPRRSGPACPAGPETRGSPESAAPPWGLSPGGKRAATRACLDGHPALTRTSARQTMWRHTRQAEARVLRVFRTRPVRAESRPASSTT